MNRLVSLLLIATFVLGPLWPHSHAGATQAGSSDHANCVHIHLRAAAHDHLRSHGQHQSCGQHQSQRHNHRRGQHHRHGRDDSHRDQLCPAASYKHLRAASTDASSPALASSANSMDHDADAIYIADVKWAYRSSSLVQVVVDTTFDLAPWASPDARSVQSDSGLRISDPQLRRCSEPPERLIKLPTYLLQTALRV